jgi:Flp pilus assembly protein TadG
MKQLSGLFRFPARWRDPVRDQSGNAAIEMALLAMPVFLFVFAIINAGRVMWLQNALDTSVTQAARCATVNPGLCGTASQIKAYAAGQSGAGFNAAIFSFAQTGCGNQVSASYPLSLTPPFKSFSLSLRAQACYPN